MKDNSIYVTSVNFRRIKGNKLLGIASVTLNNELIINDIKVILSDGKIILSLPNSEYAKTNNQSSIILEKDLYSRVKYAIIKKINQQEGKI